MAFLIQRLSLLALQEIDEMKELYLAFDKKEYSFPLVPHWDCFLTLTALQTLVLWTSNRSWLVRRLRTPEALLRLYHYTKQLYCVIC